TEIKHHQQHHHQPTATTHRRRHRTRWLPGAASRVFVGSARKWIIVLVTALVVVAACGIIIVLAISPALSLSGSRTVTAGGTLYLQGKGFLPGGSVTFTLDNGLQVSLINHSPTRTIAYSPDGGADLLDALQI